jgi:carbon-monoxide dehydrogenase medium subunit
LQSRKPSNDSGQAQGRGAAARQDLAKIFEETLMKAPDFGYDRPETLDAALAALAAGGPEARLLAGGQSLMPMLNLRVAAPALLIDVNRISDLDKVEDKGDFVRVGALTRHVTLERSALIAQNVPLIHDAIREVAHPAIRTRGTIGGSLALADPAAELPACAVALDAVIVVRSSTGERRIAASDFFTGVYETALEAGEMIVAVEVPKQANRRHAFQELSRRCGDYAIAGVAMTAALGARLDEARIVFFGVADRPIRVRAAEDAVAGLAAGSEAGARAAAALDAALEPHGDLNAPPAMKLHLAKVLLRRAVESLAGGGG